VALVALIGGVASACSSDRVMLSDGPFSNPFGGATRTAAAQPEIQPAPQPTAVAAMPTASVQSEELPPVQAAAPAPRAVASSAPVTSSAGGWSTTGGTRITVGANDSLTAISQRYGVPTNAILQANNLAAAGQVQPGREIVIPVYNASGQAVAATPAPVRVAAPAAAPAPVRTAAAAPIPAKEKLVFVVGPKPAPQKTAPAADKPDAEQKVAKTEKTRVRPGMVTAAKAAPAPVVQTAAAKPAPAPSAKPAPAPVVAQKAPEPAKPAPVVAQKAPEPAKPVVVAQKPAEPVKPVPQPEPVKVAKVEPQPAKAAPAPAVPQSANSYAPQPEVAKAPAKEVTETGGLPSGPVTDFRWPARGRVIAGFGANGGNEGINIALPEGTPVKATDDGTVTYVGGDVKAYGNLVLIKHDNGFVSAYAHNGEIAVKRGERVRRGQVVAKSGQSGNVTSPQLHFELRKGQAAVDPIPHLNGG
jgi:murein DD-endopeptidase MepM/ murein hydrolase activator NlpD